MLESIRSTEGVKVHYTAEESTLLTNLDVDETSGDELDVDDEDYAGYVICYYR